MVLLRLSFCNCLIHLLTLLADQPSNRWSRQYLSWLHSSFPKLILHQALLALILFLPYQPALTPPSLMGKTMLQKVLALDWIGTLLEMCLTITLLLPLFWGGNRYAWNDAVVIALFVVVGIFTRIWYFY